MKGSAGLAIALIILLILWSRAQAEPVPPTNGEPPVNGEPPLPPVPPKAPDIRVVAHVFCPYQYGGSWKGPLDKVMQFERDGSYLPVADPSVWGQYNGGVITSAPVGTKVALWVLIANYGDAYGSRAVRCRINAGVPSHTVSLNPGYATWVQYMLSSTTSTVREVSIDYGGPTEILTVFMFGY